ncbi:MAG: AAA family ATPase [Planctomycetaceae bacterium]|nr:AAA family ATPase [Planctomycetaceae bacterium]
MLKSLELFGFKSFADRTRFDFATGITGVVGPNGSGKSNVVDAIKWILGDQSPKSLRGQEMTDVIFNGTASRKASGFAEAMLTFDNSTGFLAIASQEVSVGRRLWKNGDAEYLINNAPSRLRDVRELLMGTGAGSAAYSIIEQGRVDQILQANASARRQVFEEAAGISLYKSRRTDAERRLQRVDQNLTRLKDIVDELEGRLNATRSQAAKAAKYRELSTELKTLWLGLAADDYRHHVAQMEHLNTEYEQTALDLEQLQAVQADLSSQLGAIDVEVAEVDDRLRELERAASRMREADARHESTLNHEASRSKELEAEIVRLRKQRTTTALRSREAAREMEHHVGVLAQAEQEFERKQADAARLEEECGLLVAQIETTRTEVTELRAERDARLEQASEIAQRRRGFEADVTQALSVQHDLQGRLHRIGDRTVEWEAERARRAAAAKEASEFLSAAEERIRRFRTERDQLAGEQEGFQRTLAEQREERSALHARKGILEDLEQREEGLSIGVREILQRSRTCPYPPWTSILGSVADLLEVDLENVGLLEVGLGTRAQLIVVNGYDALVDYLAEGSTQFAGRVGFLDHAISAEGSTEPTVHNPAFRRQWVLKGVAPAETGEGAFASDDSSAQLHSHAEIAAVPDLTGLPGVRFRLDGIVRASERAPGLAEHLLADTWVVETLDVALALASTFGRGCRFVTMQGELLEADGTLLVGSVREEAAPFSRKSELRRIKNDLLRVDFRITEEERRIAALTESLTGVDTELTAAATELRTLSDRHAGLRAELTDAERELERLQADRGALEELLASAGESETAARASLAEVEAESAEVAKAMMALAEQIADADQRVRRFEHELHALTARRNADLLELTRFEERVRGMRLSRQRLEDDQAQRLAQFDEAERRLGQSLDKLRHARLNWLNSSAERHELALTQETVSEQLGAVLREKSGLRSKRSTLLKQDGELRLKIHALEDRRHRAEITHRDLETQVATLAARIEEEYQLTLQQVVDSGASALEIYREERSKVREGLAASAHSDEDAGEAPNAQEDAYHTEATHVADSADSDEAEAAAETLMVDESMPEPDYAEARGVIEERVNRLRRKLKHMGSVNTDSLRDLDELDNKFQHLRSQLQDLVEAKTALEEIIRRINHESRRLFLETFDAVRVNFQKLFRKAFGGGDGDVVLEDQNDVLDCGIDIVARPPGKELKSITLMSGGEKTLTAFALLLAIFQCRPSPYCVLDEVDAALDEANVERLTMLLTEFEDTTQFLIITHKKPTMSVCDQLYGVTMEEAGVSKRMSVRFDDVSETGDFTAAAKERGRREAA